MSAGTKIQWCDATVNFWWGCTKVSPGCKFCYAETIARRLARGKVSWGPGGARWLREGACLALLKLNKRAEKTGTRLRVFINSMADTFEDRRDLDAARQIIFALAPCVPNLDLLLLTKRPEWVERLAPCIPGMPAGCSADAWPRNLWLGFSAENQANFDARWPVVELLGRRFGIPVLFCSAEPLLGPLFSLARSYGELGGRALDWLILGGESGPQARICELDWIRDARDQAKRFEIPVFVKQLGRRPHDKCEHPCANYLSCACGNGHGSPLTLKDSHGGDPAEWPADLRIREFPSVQSASSAVAP